MEGLTSSSLWTFDPVSSSDVLVGKHVPSNTQSSASNSSDLCFDSASSSASIDKFYNLASLTFTSLTPAAASFVIEHHSTSDNNNNNADSLITSSQYLTLDPLVSDCSDTITRSDIPYNHQGNGSFNSISSIITELPTNGKVNAGSTTSVVGLSSDTSGGLRLPKFEEIHLLRKEENPTFDFSSAEGHDPLYFNIQDLAQSYENSSSSNHSFSGLQGQEVKVEDEKEAGCDSFMEDLQQSLQNGEEEGTLYLDEDDLSSSIAANEAGKTLIEEDEKEEEDEFFNEMKRVSKAKGSPASPEEEKDLLGTIKAELKCKFCGFVCCSKSSLGIHERRHTGERPYACNHCGRLFNSAQCCKHHERLHTGDKPFECKYCKKKYAVSTRLKRHERVHTREMPYKCIEVGCGKTFRWFDAFRDHRNTHNGVALYLCFHCGKRFTSYLKFYYHERGHEHRKERERERARNANSPNNKPIKIKIEKTVKKPRKPRAKKNA